MAVAQECKNQFDEIKKGKKHRYVIFYIEEEKMIKVEAVGDRDASYDSFFMDLTKVNNRCGRVIAINIAYAKFRKSLLIW